MALHDIDQPGWPVQITPSDEHAISNGTVAGASNFRSCLIIKKILSGLKSGVLKPSPPPPPTTPMLVVLIIEDSGSGL